MITNNFNPAEGKNIHKHLSKHRHLLVQKSVEKKTGIRDWHILFRSRYEDLFTAPKIVIRQTGDHVVAAIDRVGYYCIDSVNVAAIKPDFRDDLEFFVGILNSTVIHFYYREISQEAGRVLAQVKPLRLRVLPIPHKTADQKSFFEGVVQCASCAISNAERPNGAANSTRDALMLAYWERILNGLVYELYFPEELHGAGLRLFDLIEQSVLPDVNALPEAERIPCLRQKFEELYDGTHPLRIALDRLQTLETVRTIECKA